MRWVYRTHDRTPWVYRKHDRMSWAYRKHDRMPRVDPIYNRMSRVHPIYDRMPRVDPDYDRMDRVDMTVYTIVWHAHRCDLIVHARNESHAYVRWLYDMSIACTELSMASSEKHMSTHTRSYIWRCV
jgi:hypothetical protein